MFLRQANNEVEIAASIVQHRFSAPKIHHHTAMSNWDTDAFFADGGESLAKKRLQKKQSAAKAALKQAKGEAWWVWTLDTEFGGMNECVPDASAHDIVSCP
mgnify:CR=1 FL=1